MALSECKQPVFDYKSKMILQALDEGKPKDELAREMGYSSVMAMDNYMRSRNFSWERSVNGYVPVIEKHPEMAAAVSKAKGISRAEQVLSHFRQKGSDPREVAKLVGFDNHRALADFMRGKGYAWDSILANYVRQISPAASLPDHEDWEDDGDVFVPSPDAGPAQNLSGLEDLLPLLKLLQKKGSKLKSLLDAEPEKMPRFVFPGTAKCKTVQMVDTLDRLVREFSAEKNISQREIFEVALVEFFRKYGYTEEVGLALKV